MVAMFVNGEKVGTLADAERLLPDLIARKAHVELRDDSGNALAEVRPIRREPLVPWDPTITREELNRRLAGPGLTWEEAKKWMGWE